MIKIKPLLMNSIVNLSELKSYDEEKNITNKSRYNKK